MWREGGPAVAGRGEAEGGQEEEEAAQGEAQVTGGVWRR